MASQLYSGTHAVDTTEWSCTTDSAGPDADTTAGNYRLVLDVIDMIAGDVLQIQPYEKCRAGDTQRAIGPPYILSGAQGSGGWMSEEHTFLHGWDFTLKAISGTITVLWSIRSTDSGAGSDPWDVALPGAYAAGKAGKILGDNLNATVSSRATPAQVNTECDTALTDAALATGANLATVAGYIDTEVASILAAVDTEVGAIKAKTDQLVFTVANQVDSNALSGGGGAEVTAIKAKTDQLIFTVANQLDSNVLAINGNTAAAVTLAILNGATVVYRGTVTGAATTTTLIDTGLTQADVDHWKGRIIIFTSVIAMQATDITAFDPATDKLTFTATTQAPTGATYVII